MQDNSYEVWFVHQFFSLYFFVMEASSKEQAVALATQMAKDENIPDWQTTLAQEVNVNAFGESFVV